MNHDIGEPLSHYLPLLGQTDSRQYVNSLVLSRPRGRKALTSPLQAYVLSTRHHSNRDFRTILLELAFEWEFCNGCFLMYMHVDRYYDGK